MEGFAKKERTEADGGVVNTNQKPELMSYEEYNRTKGSDGFSKNGGKVRG